jgi:RNA polymerase sigma-70 factor (ECF subfamily)
VYAIALRVRVDHYRRKRRVNFHEVATGSVPEPRATHSDGTEYLDLDVLMSRLPRAQREVIAMLKVEGLSLEDIARATSSTAGAVKQKIHRAYRNLQNFVHQERLRAQRLANRRVQSV